MHIFLDKSITFDRLQYNINICTYFYITEKLQKKLCDSFYWDGHFIAVVWNWNAISPSYVCICTEWLFPIDEVWDMLLKQVIITLLFFALSGRYSSSESGLAGGWVGSPERQAVLFHTVIQRLHSFYLVSSPPKEFFALVYKDESQSLSPHSHSSLS